MVVKNLLIVFRNDLYRKIEGKEDLFPLGHAAFQAALFFLNPRSGAGRKLHIPSGC